MKVDYGAVALIPKGEFNATEQYAVNDLVSYNGSSFIVKAVPPIGTLPTNTAYFAVNASGTSPATSSTAGTVKPDNSTIEVDNDGVISVKSEVLDRVSSSEQALTVNLNNSTKGTATYAGITLTKNGDGTYTVNGTATANAYLPINSDYTLKAGRYRLVGCPSGGTDKTYFLAATIGLSEYGNGTFFTLAEDTMLHITIGINKNTVCDNLVFKPMITANLSATYDDYVPYSGSSGKLDTDYKALSEKIGNVGNTDLQSQLNAATQSIAQNTTDIAANAAGISALNTGLTTLTNIYTKVFNNVSVQPGETKKVGDITGFNAQTQYFFPFLPNIIGEYFADQIVDISYGSNLQPDVWIRNTGTAVFNGTVAVSYMLRNKT